MTAHYKYGITHDMAWNLLKDLLGRGISTLFELIACLKIGMHLNALRIRFHTVSESGSHRGQTLQICRLIHHSTFGFHAWALLLDAAVLSECVCQCRLAIPRPALMISRVLKQIVHTRVRLVNGRLHRSGVHHDFVALLSRLVRHRLCRCRPMIGEPARIRPKVSTTCLGVALVPTVRRVRVCTLSLALSMQPAILRVGCLESIRFIWNLGDRIIMRILSVRVNDQCVAISPRLVARVLCCCLSLIAKLART